MSKERLSPKETYDDVNPLVGYATQSQVLSAQKKAEQAEAEALDFQSTPQATALEAYLSEIFEDARRYKEDETKTQETMLDCLRRRNGEYSTNKLAKIRAAGSAETYLPMTGFKCRSIEAFINDIYLNAKRKRTWDLKPTPIVTLPDDEREMIAAAVMAEAAARLEAQQQPGPNGEAPAEMTPQEAYQMASDMRAEAIRREYEIATDKAQNMARKVDDQLTEGGWSKAMAESIMDLSTLPAMVLKGPVFRNRKVKLGWKDGKVQYGQKLVVTFERVSPLDFYPSRYSQDTNDGTPLCEKIILQRSSLVENRNEPGYIKEAIEYIATKERNPGVSTSSFASEQEDAEHRDNVETEKPAPKSAIGSTVQAIEFSCSVRGCDLIEFGIVKDGFNKAIDALLDYEINAITVDGKLVFYEFNKDPLKRRPYSVCGFSKEIGGFWYKSPPQILKDIQDIINAAARAMVNNLSWASGPQVVINDVNRLSPDEDLTSFHVGKIWQGISAGGGQNQKLVDFFQPDSRSVELTRIIEDFTQMADQVIELPGYSQGSDKISGAGRTSSGLSMLMSSTNRGMKRVILDVDRNVVSNAISQVVDYNLDNDEDDSIKGDMHLTSDGIVALMMKEQLSERRLQFLTATQNEFDMKVIGIDGRAKILADAMESLESNYDDIVPTEAKIEALLKQEEQLQSQQLRENEMKIREKEALIERESDVARAEVELAMNKLDLEKRAQDLEFKNKERELDIRSDKQSGDRILKLNDQAAKEEEAIRKEKEPKTPEAKPEVKPGAKPNA